MYYQVMVVVAEAIAVAEAIVVAEVTKVVEEGIKVEEEEDIKVVVEDTKVVVVDTKVVVDIVGHLLHRFLRLTDLKFQDINHYGTISPVCMRRVPRCQFSAPTDDPHALISPTIFTLTRISPNIIEHTSFLSLAFG